MACAFRDQPLSAARGLAPAEQGGDRGESREGEEIGLRGRTAGRTQRRRPAGCRAQFDVEWFGIPRESGSNDEGESIMFQCTECGADIDVEMDEVDEGDILSCDECGAVLRVVSVDPPELELDEEADEFEEEEEEEEEGW